MRLVQGILCAALMVVTQSGRALSADAEVVVTKEDDFVTISLPVIRQAGDPEAIHARGLYHGVPVGLELRFPQSWKQGELKGNVGGAPIRIPTQSGPIVLASAGADSDQFVKFLAEQYHVNPPPRHVKAVVTVKAVSLGGDHPDYKLFFEPPAAPEYAGLYLELLEGGNRVSISEKAAVGAGRSTAVR